MSGGLRILRDGDEYCEIMKSGERDYFLGTHDEEIVRLGGQHEVWRERALDAWGRGGFSAGQTLLDIGCGPGYATLDLAGIVGPEGKVFAFDRSRRFLDVAEARARDRGLDQVEAFDLDLDRDALPVRGADGAWCRWVFAFMRRPRALLGRIASALRPGGVLVVHEYLDYSTWRLAPRLPELEEFVAAVMTNWRATGGEPDVGLDLPGWLTELGFETRSIRPILEVVPASHPTWRWPASFIQVNLERLVGERLVTEARARSIAQAFASAEARPGTLMITPAVIEIIAARGEPARAD